jgi:hypothetical protein
MIQVQEDEEVKMLTPFFSTPTHSAREKSEDSQGKRNVFFPISTHLYIAYYGYLWYNKAALQSPSGEAMA